MFFDFERHQIGVTEVSCVQIPSDFGVQESFARMFASSTRVPDTLNVDRLFLKMPVRLGPMVANKSPKVQILGGKNRNCSANALQTTHST